MPFLSNTEYYEMMLCVGAADGSLRAARDLYRERFIDTRPEAERRNLPSLECFRRMVLRLRETGTFRGVRAEGRPTTQDPYFEESVLEHFQENPRTSTRRAAAVLNANHMKVWRVLRDDGQHPYHFQKTQELTPADFGPRREFCQWYRNQVLAVPGFAATVLWTDEATFTRDGISNVHNEHVWSHTNPHASTESSFQHQWRVNVWAGIVGGKLIGPKFLPDRLNGENYLEHLRNYVERQLESEFTLPDYLQIIYQHDGAPAHFARAVREYLDNRFPQWIGRGGRVAWPARSPDLTPLDFFLWGHVKNIVYAVPCDTDEEMQQKIITAFRSITPQMLRNTEECMLRRTELCIERQGGHFEPFL